MAQKFESLVEEDERFEVAAARHLGMVVFRLKGENDQTEKLLKNPKPSRGLKDTFYEERDIPRKNSFDISSQKPKELSKCTPKLFKDMSNTCIVKNVPKLFPSPKLR